MLNFQAYKRWVETNGEEYVLPKINKTNAEMFFIGYAQVSLVLMNSTTFGTYNCNAKLFFSNISEGMP